MSQTKSTTDHNTIKKWAEERDAKPAVVENTENGNSALLRLDFPGYSGKNLKEVSWEEWFKIFDKNNLALIYQEKTNDGSKSNFNKIVDKKTAEEAVK